MLSNLKIGIRLSIGFAIALLLLIVVAAIGVTRIGELQTEITGLVKDKNVKTKLANDIIDDINGVGRWHRNMLILRSDAGTRSRNGEDCRRAKEGHGTASTRSTSSATATRGKTILDTAKDARKSFVGASLKIEEMIKAKQWDEASSTSTIATALQFDAYTAAVNAFIDYQTELAEKVGADAENLAASTRTLILGPGRCRRADRQPAGLPDHPLDHRPDQQDRRRHRQDGDRRLRLHPRLSTAGTKSANWRRAWKQSRQACSA
jgi:methyl-accepting chemotaxis protein